MMDVSSQSSTLLSRSPAGTWAGAALATHCKTSLHCCTLLALSCPDGPLSSTSGQVVAGTARSPWQPGSSSPGHLQTGRAAVFCFFLENKNRSLQYVASLPFQLLMYPYKCTRWGRKAGSAQEGTEAHHSCGFVHTD